MAQRATHIDVRLHSFALCLRHAEGWLLAASAADWAEPNGRDNHLVAEASQTRWESKRSQLGVVLRRGG